MKNGLAENQKGQEGIREGRDIQRLENAGKMGGTLFSLFKAHAYLSRLTKSKRVHTGKKRRKKKVQFWKKF